jgi:hypothetical protein
MSPVPRTARIASIAIILSFAAPLALADELPPAPGLASRSSSQSFVTDRSRNNWETRQVMPNQRAADSWAGRSERVNPSRRASSLMRKGVQAERRGDMADACGYYQQARQAFVQARSPAGVNGTDHHIDRTCQS